MPKELPVTVVYEPVAPEERTRRLRELARLLLQPTEQRDPARHEPPPAKT